MKKLGLKDLRSAVLRRFGLSEPERLPEQIHGQTSETEVIDDVDGLPPELADYPGVRKLLAEAQKQHPGASARSDGRAVLDPPIETRRTEPDDAQRVLGLGESSKAIPSPATQEPLEQDSDSAASARIDNSVSEVKGRGHHDSRLAENHPHGRATPIPSGVAEWSAASGAAVAPKGDKRNSTSLRSKLFDWVVLLVLCIGLAFAIGALATLFKTTHAPH